MNYAVGAVGPFNSCRSRLTMLSRQLRFGNVLALACVMNKSQSINRSCSSALLFLQQVTSLLSTNFCAFDTINTTISVNSLSRIFMILFLSTRGIPRVHSCSVKLCFQRFFIFTISYSGIFTDTPMVRCCPNLGPRHDPQISLDLRVRCPTAENFSQDWFRWGFISPLIKIEEVIFEEEWNELFPAIPIHPYLEMHPHFQTKVALNRNHENTIMSEIEILSSFARDLCSTAPHFVYTNT